MRRKIRNLKKEITQRLKDKNSLFSRVAKGGAWLGIGSGIENFLRLIRNIVLTRILLPDAFGTMAILLAAANLFESLTQVGINAAIIQHSEGDEETFLNGAWWFSLLRGTGLYIIAFLLAPVIAEFYNSPELASMMRLVFLSLFFFNAMSVKAHVAYKKLDFKKWILVEQLGGVVGICSAVILSIIYKNAWGLAIGFVIESAARFVLSFIVCPYLPRLRFKKEHLHDLFKFTRGMLGIPVFTFIFMNIDVFIIGKVLNQEFLGFYSMALSLARLPSTFMQKFIFPLFMPAFSEIKDDIPRLSKINLLILFLFALFGIPLIIFTFFYGKEILSLFYTEAYGRVALPFAILVATQILMSFNAPIVSNYLALARPNSLRIFTIIRALTVSLLVFPATMYFHLTGAALSVLIAMAVSYFFQVILLDKIMRIGVKNYFGQFLPGIAFCIPLFIAGFSENFFAAQPQGFSLIIGCSALALSYLIGAIYFIKKHKSLTIG